MKRIRSIAFFFFAGAAMVRPQTATPSAVSNEDLYKIGKNLFDAYAPEEIKKDYEFPSKDQWDNFLSRFQAVLQGDSLEQLASYEDEARAALGSLPLLLNTTDYNGWLNNRLDYSNAARDIVVNHRPAGPPTDKKYIPYYDSWLVRMKSRARPRNADALMPKLKSAFQAEHVPTQLVWLAETESDFNSSALSPAGAKGLFQLMPATAKARGLSTFLPDDRIDPEKSARAAAKELHALHQRFGSWPLALAAYNVGEGRVGRLLAGRTDRSYAAIAAQLPVETRMYVPKVMATISVRENTGPERLESEL